MRYSNAKSGSRVNGFTCSWITQNKDPTVWLDGAISQNKDPTVWLDEAITLNKDPTVWLHGVRPRAPKPLRGGGEVPLSSGYTAQHGGTIQEEGRIQVLAVLAPSSQTVGSNIRVIHE